MKSDEKSLTTLKRITTLALMFFAATMVFGPDARAESCTDICEEALREGGSLEGEADEACENGWEYYNCYWKTAQQPVCRILCHGDPGNPIELEVPPS